MSKVFSVVVAAALAGGILWRVPPARAEEGPIAGIELGAMIPRGSLRSFVDTGGEMSPFAGYMFNNYIGLWGHLEVWAANTQERIGKDDHVTWAGAFNVGPRVVFPLGSIRLWGTFEPGVFTGLNDQTLTKTSFGYSTGGGVEVPITDALYVGAFGRWNWADQFVHGTNDVKFITAGMDVTYTFGLREEAPPPPPPAPPPLAQAPPPPPPVKQKIVLRGVNFDFDKSAIRPDARPVLDEAIQILKQYGNVSVICQGYTDSIGSQEYNMKLSLRRANAVRDYLVAGGIAASRIAVEGFGKSDPVASNDTADGRAQNRRVELRVTSGG